MATTTPEISGPEHRPARAPAPTTSVVRAAARLPQMRWAALATVFFVAGAVFQVAGAPHWVWWSLYLSCYAAGGWASALSGMQALREKTLDVDLLMVVAAVLAASIGQVFDGALLIVILATSEALRALATKRKQDSAEALLARTPTKQPASP